MTALILLRHGESKWNKKKLFTGWFDINLTKKGQEEAFNSGKLLLSRKLFPEIVYTSLLYRSLSTTYILLDTINKLQIPIYKNWRLNERHYGALQGSSKKFIKEKYGEKQFVTWRRYYTALPPKIDQFEKFQQYNDPKYKIIGGGPLTESLEDVTKRFIPYYKETIVPTLESNKIVLIVAHGNLLRALIKYLDSTSNYKIAGLDIPTGVPIYYKLDINLMPVIPGGTYIRMG